ncbi:MAG: amidase [Chloroflexi bacterium]|nr:amidase [Chloroflexota bacterium]
MMDNAAIRALTLVQVRDALAAGELTSEAVVGAAIEQALRFKDEFSLFMTFLGDQAMEQALTADKARAAGQPPGALFGVPFTVKDNIEHGGVRSSSSSRMMEDHIPAQDATAVANIKAQGGISLGQTMCWDLAGGWTYISPFFKPVRNPWNPDLIPGGSSSGAGAAVALRVGYAGLGTDVAGSVRGPASVCGVVGLKQTHGTVSTAGLLPTAPASQDHIGPLTRTVADSRLMFSIMAGYDPRDFHSSDRPLEPYPALSSLAGMKVGMPEDFFWDDLDPEIERVCRTQIEMMRAAGAEIVPVKFETLRAAKEAASVLFAENLPFYEPYLRDRPQFINEAKRTRLAEARSYTAVDFSKAMHARQAFVLEMRNALHAVDALVPPTSYIPAHTMELAAKQELNVARNRTPFNQTGAPTITIPAAVHSNGALFGLQITTLHFTDYKMFAIAEFMEGLIGFDTTPPVLRGVAAAV